MAPSRTISIPRKKSAMNVDLHFWDEKCSTIRKTKSQCLHHTGAIVRVNCNGKIAAIMINLQIRDLQLVYKKTAVVTRDPMDNNPALCAYEKRINLNS